ncbi:SLC13 family permease [Dongshaea marina]|uniref:SLC13 family permease n=1 Tax=Dongshaea marina TaxID=2047966 RepID=UPI000D3E50FE|nr:SLC13 family permease [Dongshaea marina]
MSDRIALSKLVITLIITGIILLIPTHSFPIEGLTVVQHRIIAIFIMAALLWVLEPVPVFATSLLIITLLLISVSDKGLHFLISHGDGVGHPLGALLSYKMLLGSFSSPIIILFLGGFSLAIAASKYELDANLARVLLRPFGKKIHFVMLGLMLITAMFSMFMSNTATTVMMMAIIGPLIAANSAQDPGLKALILAIPIAANTGGIGTPIGTPPNAIAMQYLQNGGISFAQWMSFGIPFVAVQLMIGWLLLRKLYPAQTPELKIDLEGKFQQGVKPWIVYITFAATILLWLTTAWHGMNTYVVAIIPLAVFSLTGIITKQELKQINWDVLWLVAGGIAMGLALDKSGLAVKLAHAIRFDELDGPVIIIVMTLVCYLMANFMSNTATANLLMPIAAAIGSSADSLLPFGGQTSLLVFVALSASLGMILPVSTPPNALAYSSGLIETRDLMKTGIILGGSGLFLIYLAMAVSKLI